MLAGIPMCKKVSMTDGQEMHVAHRALCCLATPCPRRPGTRQAGHECAQLVGTTKSVVDVLTKGGEAKAPHIKPMRHRHRGPGRCAGRLSKTLKCLHSQRSPAADDLLIPRCLRSCWVA